MVHRALALKVEHRVHDVLEGLWARNAATLGDVAHHEDCRPALLGKAHQASGTLTDLPHVARRTLEIPSEHGLNGIHDHHRGAHIGGRCENRLEIRLAEQRDSARRITQAIRAQLHLQGRFLATYVKRRVPSAFQPCGHLQENRALTNARLAAHQHHRPGHDAPAEHEVKLRNPRCQAIRLRAVHIAQPRRLGNHAAITECGRTSAPPRRPCALGRTDLGGRDFLDERVPFSARVAASLPLEGFCATLRAAVDGARLHRHGCTRWRITASADITATPADGARSSRSACDSCGNAAGCRPWARYVACRRSPRRSRRGECRSCR